MAVGAIIGAAINAGSSIYGAIKSAQTNKEVEELIGQQRYENSYWYDQKKTEDFMKRTEVQNVLRKQRELLNEQYANAKAANLVSGGTDESLALQQQAANQAMGDTMAAIASQATSHREGIEQQFRAEDKAIAQQQRDMVLKRGEAIAEAASQIGSSVGGLISKIGS